MVLVAGARLGGERVHLSSKSLMFSVGENLSLCEPVSPPACQAGEQLPWVL